jgi:integrase
MSVECHSDGRFRYRVTAYYNDGTPCRISGTAPKSENTRKAALRCEAEHIARMASQPPPPTPGTTEGANGTNHAGPLTVDPTPTLAGTAPASIRAEPVKPSIPTIRDFVPVYLASSRLGNKISWYLTKKSILTTHIVPRLGDLRLDEITFAVVEDFKIALAETQHARVKGRVRYLHPKTINNVLTALQHMLRVARKRDLIEKVPEFVPMKTPPSKFDFLTFDDADRLIAHAVGEWRTMIIVALRTGLRRGELLGLRWEDVDLVRGKIFVRQNYVCCVFGDPKSGKPREVPLSGQARQALEAHRHVRGELVFCDAEGRPLRRSAMEHGLWRMCRLAKLRPIGWHTLRHSFASHLVMRGVPIRAVQELMGHWSVSVTQRYAHLDPHVSRDAVQLLDSTGMRPEPPQPAPVAAEPTQPTERRAAVAAEPAQPTAQRAAVAAELAQPTAQRAVVKSRRTARTRGSSDGLAAKNRQETSSAPV